MSDSLRTPTSLLQNKYPDFKPYHIYSWDGAHWLCKCGKNPKKEEDENNNRLTIECSKCDNWGHIDCYDLNNLTQRELKRYKHKCFDCKSKSQRGRPRNWTKKEDEILKNMKNEGESIEIIGRALCRTPQSVKRRYTLNQKKNNNETEEEQKADQLLINTINTTKTANGIDLLLEAAESMNTMNKNIDFNEDKEEDEVNDFNKSFLNYHQIRSLKVGDKFDHKDYEGRYLPAHIMQIKYTKFEIHYQRYREKYNVWRDFKEIQYGDNQFAHYQSISMRKNHTLSILKKNDYIKVRINDNKWEYCKIIKFDKRINGESGQIKVTNNNGYSYWYHPDDVENVQLITNKSEIYASTNRIQQDSSRKRLRGNQDNLSIPNKKRRLDDNNA